MSDFDYDPDPYAGVPAGADPDYTDDDSLYPERPVDAAARAWVRDMRNRGESST